MFFLVRLHTRFVEHHNLFARCRLAAFERVLTRAGFLPCRLGLVLLCSSKNTARASSKYGVRPFV